MIAGLSDPSLLYNAKCVKGNSVRAGGTTSIEAGFVVRLAAHRPAFGFRDGRVAGRVVERLEEGFAVAVEPGQQRNLLFGGLEPGIARLEQADAPLIPGEALVKRRGAVLQVAEDLFEFGQGLFERRVFAHGVS